MKERIGQIARGEIKYEKPELLLEPQQIEEPLAAGFTYRRELNLYSTNRIPVRGLVYSNQKQVALQDNQFAGTRCRLQYTVNTADVRPGAEIAGEFRFVTNGAELSLPYRFTVTDAAGEERPLQSLDELYELTLKDEKQAVRIFAAPDFVKREFCRELRCLALYESLIRGGDERAALFAFLRGMGYSLPERNPQKDDGAEDPMPPKARYSSLEGLNGLNNYRHLMDLLLEYQCGKYPAQRLLPELEKEAVRLCKVYPGETFPVLMRAYLALESGYTSAATKLLEDAYHAVLDKRRTETVNYCFYLYLRTRIGIPEEQRESIIKLLDKYYQELGYPFGLLFLVLTVDVERSRDVKEVLHFLKAEYNRGTHSPFLYAEALKWYSLRPELLTVLDDFEWELFRFSLDYGMAKPAPKKALRHAGSRVLQQAAYDKIRITEKLTAKIAGLAVRERRYRKENAEVLMRLYESFPSDELLTAILSLLMLGAKYGAEYFSWYQQGIEHSLQLMGIYEAYLASLPADYEGELPRELVLFYSFRGDLREELQETLYANILRLYPVGSEIYENYKEQMEQFAIVQLLKGRISPQLAPIYQHILYREMIDERLSAVLPDLLFARQIHCPQAGMDRLLIRYPEFSQEIGFPLNGSSDICCPVYTEDALLLFADERGARHVYPDTTVQPLMEDRGLLAICRQWDNPDPMLNLLSCREAMARSAPQEGDWGLLSAASGDAQLHPLYRRLIVSRILQCWDSFREEPEADDFLVNLDASAMDRRERARYVQLLVAEKHINRAFAVVAEHGYTGVNSDVLHELTAGVIKEEHDRYLPVLLELALSLYRRERDDAVIMEYICRFFNGGTAQMRAVLERACAQRAQLHDLPERLLAQMLFTGLTEGIETVFYIYAAQNRVYHVLAQSFFVWKSYRYLAAREELPDYFYSYLEKYWQEAQFASEGQILVSAVLLEHLIAEGAKQKMELMQQLTDLLCENGRYFAFFRDLPEKIVLPDGLNGCMILEYRSDLPGDYYVRYDLFPDAVNSGYLRMNKACEGVYTEPVMLFAGEWISVTYVRRYQGQEEVLISEQTVRFEKPYCIPGSLYAHLNRVSALLAKDTAQDREAAVRELAEIRVRECLLARLTEEYRKGGGESGERPHDRV